MIKELVDLERKKLEIWKKVWKFGQKIHKFGKELESEKNWKFGNLEKKWRFALLPLWSDFSGPVWTQTIYRKVVWIWSEFSPFRMNLRNNDYVNFGLISTVHSQQCNLQLTLIFIYFYKLPNNISLHYFGFVYKFKVAVKAYGWRISKSMNFFLKWWKSIRIWSEFQYFFVLN